MKTSYVFSVGCGAGIGGGTVAQLYAGIQSISVVFGVACCIGAWMICAVVAEGKGEHRK